MTGTTVHSLSSDFKQSSICYYCLESVFPYGLQASRVSKNCAESAKLLNLKTDTARTSLANQQTKWSIIPFVKVENSFIGYLVLQRIQKNAEFWKLDKIKSVICKEKSYLSTFINMVMFKYCLTNLLIQHNKDNI